jgi:hypothetical protein
MEIYVFLHVYLGKPIFGWYEGCHNIWPLVMTQHVCLDVDIALGHIEIRST